MHLSCASLRWTIWRQGRRLFADTSWSKYFWQEDSALLCASAALPRARLGNGSTRQKIEHSIALSSVFVPNVSFFALLSFVFLFLDRCIFYSVSTTVPTPKHAKHTLRYGTSTVPSSLLPTPPPIASASPLLRWRPLPQFLSASTFPVSSFSMPIL